METAEEIVKALADWSNKYPLGRVYSMNNMSMDEELIEIENMAKEYANQSREEGSGKLEEVFRNFIRTEQLTAKWEEFLSNNNH